jgi:hypothetical protein
MKSSFCYKNIMENREALTDAVKEVALGIYTENTKDILKSLH